MIQKFRNEQNKGKVIPFEETAITDESNIITLSDGAMGGKGRGLAFINTLIHNYDFSQVVPNIRIRAPKTSIIGTEEYEIFLERNKILELVLNENDYEKIKEIFLKGILSEGLIKKLRLVLKYINKPIAIRSSGLFEDSLAQPFAGIFETYLLPNNHPDIKERLRQVLDAIKLVYASVFSEVARGYIEAVNYKIEDEKMAVVVQEVVGNEFNNYYYPHFSGVAQSYNYYPFAHMKPEEGFAMAAVGLGKYVVEGERSYRFSPKYPTTEISSSKDQNKNTQVEFYAVDLDKKNVDFSEGDMAGLSKLNLIEAENHGTLKHCASVYNPDRDLIIPGIDASGPRIINFANILKYNYIPLAQTIEAVLDVGKEAMGTPVEIEFAVDLNKDEDYKASLYILQIKPLLGNALDYDINLDELDKEKIIMFSEKCMGNGIIQDIYDVIFTDNSTFEKSKTIEMQMEIDQLNQIMKNENRNYVLIGPGRWGSRDRYIGIPVNWPQISNAKVIVETSLEDYPLDASSGSHFFHNVTSMNVGYFSVQPEVSNSYIKWDILEKRKDINKTKYFKHIRFDDPLVIRMDGKKRISVISLE
ncbi:PEP/pyruvate-binding domain-containing protein [Bacteroidota bacterium]